MGGKSGVKTCLYCDSLNVLMCFGFGVFVGLFALGDFLLLDYFLFIFFKAALELGEQWSVKCCVIGCNDSKNPKALRMMTLSPPGISQNNFVFYRPKKIHILFSRYSFFLK